MSKESQIFDFFSLYRHIFSVCPHSDCGAVFRLSDAQMFLSKKPVNDWMDELDQMDAQLSRLEGKLSEMEEKMREEARAKGRKLAQKTIRKIDHIFAPHRLSPDDAKVIFHPIDYVIFNGMKGGSGIKNIILLDREGTTRDQLRLQRSIEKTVEKGRFEWQTLRVASDGTVSTEK